MDFFVLIFVLVDPTFFMANNFFFQKNNMFIIT